MTNVLVVEVMSANFVNLNTNQTCLKFMNSSNSEALNVIKL